jgi:hypothetical protein
VKSVKPEEVFEKITCEHVQRKIELKFSSALGGDGVVEKVDDQGASSSVGFGLMFPVTRGTNEAESAENIGSTEDDISRGSTITAEELEGNRVSSRGKCNVLI